MRPQAEGQSTVRVEGSTVGEIVQELVRRFPGLAGQLIGDDGGLRPFVNLYRNDEDVRYLGKLDAQVCDDDVISILPAVAGG